jgi:hypothetical protein
MNSEIDVFHGISVDFELQRADRDLPISVHDSVHTEAEDIFRGLERGRDFKLSKQRPLLLEGSLKTKIGNLLGGRVNLAVVISMDFFSQDLLGRFDIGDIFSDTGSNQMVLEPPVRSFDLSLRLGRERMGDFDIAVSQDLFPLRGGLIGQKVVFSPDGISSLDKSKDGMRIDIIGERKAITKEDGLECLDVSPSSFFFNESGI